MADDLNMDGTLYVCATAQHNTVLTQLAYEALTWVEIGKIVTLPQIGIEANSVVQNYVNTDMSQAAKGYFNGTTSEIMVGRDPVDAGQVILRAAADARYRYAFKRVYADDVVGFTPTITYFRALVTSRLDAGGGGEEFDNETFSVTVTSQRPIIVAPAAV